MDFLLRRPGLVLFSFLLSLLPLLSFFALYPIHLETDVRRGFAHRYGRSKGEFQKFADHFGLSYDGLELWVVLITSKGKTGEALEVDQRILDEVERLDNHLHNFSFIDSNGNVAHSSDIFGGEINHLFKWYKEVFPLASFSSSINLTFPMASVDQHKLFLGSHFFGVNGGAENGPIETAQTIGLWYISDAPGFEKKKLLEDVEMDIFRLSLNDSFSDLISFEMFGDQVANAEMFRGTVEARYLFIIGAFLMVIFMALMFRHLTVKSRMWMIVGAMSSPALATASTFALLGWLGASLNSIMCITPFLVLAIGVDDGFLLLHSWRLHLKKQRGGEGGVEGRARLIRAVLTSVAPSMAVTSATNTLAFGVGIFSPTTQMSGFCLATAIAILLDFFFEFLVFTPIMALCYEEKPKKDKRQGCQSCSAFSWRNYAFFLLSPPGKASVATILAALYASSFLGMAKLETAFDPSKAFPSDSQLVSSLVSFEGIQQEYAPLNLISRRVPRIDNETEVAEYAAMINSLDSRPLCKKEYTQNPLMGYIEWARLKGGNSSLSYNQLPQFLDERMLAKLKIINYREENGEVTVDGVSSFLVCRGEMNWNKRGAAVEEIRALLDAYPQFSTSLFDYDSTIYDIVISVREEILRAVAITLLCMGAAAALFIPSVVAASVAVVSMLSITFTMLGSLSHWGASLDPVIMVNVLIAIGFSVDFSAHICYHFNRTRFVPLRCKKERIGEILEAVGKPIFEASLSTFICVLPLFALKIYIFNSFAKTVCLVAVLGLFHGVVVIPVILSFFLPAPSEEGREEGGEARTSRPLLQKEVEAPKPLPYL